MSGGGSMGGRSGRSCSHGRLLVLVVLLALASAVTGVGGPFPPSPPPHARDPTLYATVTGRVFCDTCNDGERNDKGGPDVPIVRAVVQLDCYSADQNPGQSTVFPSPLGSFQTTTNSAGFYNFSSLAETIESVEARGNDRSTFLSCKVSVADMSHASPKACSAVSPVMEGCGRQISVAGLHAGGTYYAGQFCTTYQPSLPECNWQDSNTQCAKRLVYSSTDSNGPVIGNIYFLNATIVGDSGGLLYTSPPSLATFSDKFFLSVVVGETVYWIETAGRSMDMIYILSTRADYVRQPPNYALGAVTAQVPPFRLGTGPIFNFAVDTSELPDKLYFFFTYTMPLDESSQNGISNQSTIIYSAASWRDNPLKVYETDTPESVITDASILHMTIDTSVSPRKLYWIEYTQYYTIRSGSTNGVNKTTTLKRANISRSRSTLTYVQTLYSATNAIGNPFPGIISSQVDSVHKRLYVTTQKPLNTPFGSDYALYLVLFDISVNPPRMQFTRPIGMRLNRPLLDIYSSPPVLYGIFRAADQQIAYKMRLNLTGSGVLTYGPRLSIGSIEQYVNNYNLLYGVDCLPA